MKSRCDLCKKQERVIKKYRKNYRVGENKEFVKKVIKLCNRCKGYNYYTVKGDGLWRASVYKDWNFHLY